MGEKLNFLNTINFQVERNNIDVITINGCHFFDTNKLKI